MVNFIKRNWFNIFIYLWLVVYAFLPARPEPLAQVELSSKGIYPYLFTVWQFIPLCLVIILLVAIVKKKEMQVRSIKYIALAILPITLLLDILAGQTPLVWGTVASGGLMIAIVLLITDKFKHLGEFKALLIGSIWAFTFAYTWELMYQVILY